MSEEQDATDEYASEIAKYESYVELETERNRLHRLISHSEKNVNAIFKSVEDLPAQIAAEIDSMKETKAWMEYSEQASIEKLQTMKRTYDEAIEKHSQELDAQKDKLDDKVVELNALEEEINCVQITLDEKQSSVTELHQQMSAETDLFEKQAKLLSDLTAISKIEEDHNALQAELARLNEMQSAEKASIDAIRQDNAALTDELSALHTETGLRNDELVPLQARFDELSVKYADEERENFRIASELQAAQERRTIEIARLELQLADQEAANENLKKMRDNMFERMNSEFGSAKSLEQMVMEARAELQKLEDECSGLNASITDVTKSIHASDAKLSKLDVAKEEILQRLETPQIIPQPPSSQHSYNSRASNANRFDNHQDDVLDSSSIEEEDENEEGDRLFSPPSKYRRTEKTSYPQEQHHKPKGEPASPSPDSSVAESPPECPSSLFGAKVANNRAGQHYERINVFQRNLPH